MKQTKHRKNLDYARKKEVQDDSQIFDFDNWNYWENKLDYIFPGNMERLAYLGLSTSAMVYILQ